MPVDRKKITRRLLSALIAVPVATVLLIVGGFYALFYFPQRSNGSLEAPGGEREYFLFVPSSYNSDNATPLIISLHGAALWPAAQREMSRWNRLAEEEGFIVVYPSGTWPYGTGTGLLPKFWLLRPEEELDSNLQFLSGLVEKIERDYNIDPARIYANGFSNGAAMAFALSCRFDKPIAAVGTVGAAYDQQPFQWCGNPRPMPLIAFHGTADPIVPYEGGQQRSSPGTFPSVRSWTADWAARNGCRPQPKESRVAATVARRAYLGCTDGADVVLYTLDGGGHTWPGGKPLPKWLVGPTNPSIDATSQMWSFFRQYRAVP
ncbi:MAG: hypothetical protein K0U98_00215 [Deltaproteobacteria bacterium]|nr:hypothetical protein [Deltaproteobacteria bacterium]